METGVGGLVLAGGWGSVRGGRSKLLEPIDPPNGLPMVVRVTRLLQNLVGSQSTHVVINHRYGTQIRHVLERHGMQQFVVQSDRTGAAGAVRESLPVIVRTGDPSLRHLLVLYGDMPLWRPISIARLLACHLATEGDAPISMFSIAIEVGCPEMVRRFGRILRDAQGTIIGIREPFCMESGELAVTKTVNPSAWVYDLSWLQEALPLLHPHDRGDGYTPEYWLPDLVEVAVRQGRHVNEVRLADPSEAMGVNTLEELQEVRTYFAQHYASIEVCP